MHGYVVNAQDKKKSEASIGMELVCQHFYLVISTGSRATSAVLPSPPTG